MATAALSGTVAVAIFGMKTNAFCFFLAELQKTSHLCSVR